MSKRNITLHLSDRDARLLAQMLSVYAGHCEDKTRACFDAVPLGAGRDHPEYDRANAAIRSWSRHARKAKALAAAFDQMARDADTGYQMGRVDKRLD